MSNQKVKTLNMAIKRTPEGDILAKRKRPRSFLGITLGLLLVGTSLWFFYKFFYKAVTVGEVSAIVKAVSLLLFGGFLLVYGFSELKAPDILIGKITRTITLQSRWPFEGQEQSLPFSQFKGIIYHVLGVVRKRGREKKMYGISLLTIDDKIFPFAEVTPKQRESVVKMLKDVIGIPELDYRWIK